MGPASCSVGSMPIKNVTPKEKRDLEKFAVALNSIASMKKTVTAVNYDVSTAASFVDASLSKGKRKAGNDARSECTRTSTGTGTPCTSTISRTPPTRAGNRISRTPEIVTGGTITSEVSSTVVANEANERHTGQPSATPPHPLERSQTCSGPSATLSKRPRRQRKAPQISKHHVRYNMSKTPQFKKDPILLRHIRCIDKVADRRGVGYCQTTLGQATTTSHENCENTCPSSQNECSRLQPSNDMLSLSQQGENSARKQKEIHNSPLGDSVVWCPGTREQWSDCSSEMAALCAEAALRSALLNAIGMTRSSEQACASDVKQRPIPVAPTPLSKEYISDRIDIDDPLNGFQIRHREGGWLQGFVLWTTFTSWVRYFKWDSTHNKSGMASHNSNTRGSRRWDEDGLLSTELEAQPRAGDPLKGGVIWPTVAEIGLVGGLGCGEYLLRMAMDDICRQNRYKFILLQATETSLGFYERFGFTRVGAVCKYGDSSNLYGYRHWTFADEENLEVHGGPSYMMAKRISGVSSCEPERVLSSRSALDEVNISTEMGDSSMLQHDAKRELATSFLELVKDEFVDCKPSILSLNKQDHFFEPSRQVSVDELMKQACDRDDPQGSNSSKHSVSDSPVGEPPLSIAEPSVTCTASNSVAPSCLECKHREVQDTSVPVDNLRSKRKHREVQDTAVPVDNLRSKRIKLSNVNNHRPERTARVSITPSNKKRDFPSLRSSSSLSMEGMLNCEISSMEPSCGGKKLRKQKFTHTNSNKSGPSFFNKVVAKKEGNRTRGSYYFVLHYATEIQRMRLIKIAPCGTFIGKREGRVRWKAVANTATPDSIQTAECSDWEIVPAYAVCKTAYVHEESWDILEEDSKSSSRGKKITTMTLLPRGRKQGGTPGGDMLHQISGTGGR